MSKLIFINLFIDNAWDEEKVIDQIFSVKLNSSTEILDSYQSWGVFEGVKGDYAIVAQKLDPGFRKFLSEKIEIADEVFIDDLESINLTNITQFHFAGISQEEQSLIARLPFAKNNYLSEALYKKLNSKLNLFEMAQVKNIKFPFSSVIQFKDFKKLEEQALPYVLKYQNSAGGRGVFIINENTKNMISFIERQLEESSGELTFLKQTYVEIDSHFYTLSHTNFSPDQVSGFKIIYDKHKNSKLHIHEKTLSDERVKTAEKIARGLRESGYSGVFGFDGFESSEGEIFPAVDLNVRHDKSRMILNLAKKLNIHNHYFEFRRERFHSKSYESFDIFWNNRVSELDEINKKYGNRFYLIPVLFSNFFKRTEQSDMVEISFFCGQVSSELTDYDSWIGDIYKWLGIPVALT